MDAEASTAQRSEDRTDDIGNGPLDAGSENGVPMRRFARPRMELVAPTRDLVGIPEGDQPRVILDRDTLFRRMLAVADIAAAAVALNIAAASTKGHLAVLGVVAIPFVLLLSKISGLYDRDEHLIRKSTLDEGPSLLLVATVSTLLVWLFERELIAGASLGRVQVAVLWILLLVSLLTARAVVRRLGVQLAPPERCLLVGDQKTAKILAKKFSLNRAANAELVGRIPHAEERQSANGNGNGHVNGNGNGSPAGGYFDGVEEAIHQHRIDRVIVVPHWRDADQTLELIRVVKAVGVKASVVPRLFEVVGTSVEVDDVNGFALLGVPRSRLTRSSSWLKRGVDLAGAVTGLALAAPLLLTIALAVKLGSRGPIFFRQHRIGREGRQFDMLKFRTMYDGADRMKADLAHRNEAEDGFFKIADDPRITPIGRLLRRMSIDELPQLINVLRGEMSLVGPRPLVPEEDRNITGWQRRRLDMNPGITGVWQVLGSSANVPLDEMVKLDYLYRSNWSVWLDMKVMLRTVPHVLSRRGL
jgi:exopolysaccharide biosynthesis polyprenyl glycosylphosphotransferase